jgi:molecular chaperone Hsp33
MSDYIVRAMAAEGQIRAFSATTRELVEKARELLYQPLATELWKILTAGTMMGCMMKGENDLLTLQIRGTGPIQGLVVSADSSGKVKGYVFEPNVILPADKNKKLNVSEAIGAGMLSVTRDLSLKEPYSSQTHLVTGEIAKTLLITLRSEQIPSQ